ncbi:site-specific integrase [Salinarchaeum sp. IM2453]|uniref:tyrosine-type recombinase/integrase n=1 Tax=Salinarchaeum sp. IM2453 TaxID=2862870 RepID=UPI001C83632D|nr:site-specific integrase [Salinarchaeum sp. IM2453]QZA89495.1 site-specific integrase [Salinarchaeum sp. IM2453]
MNLQEHKNSSAMMVWLSTDELKQLVDCPDDVQRQLALKLGGYCGLRSAEVVNVKPAHVRDTQIGKVLEVPAGKGDKYRETPIPDGLAGQIRTIGQYEGEDTTVVGTESTRTLRRWINTAANELAEQTENNRWEFLSFHDLRRTWATLLASADVDPMVAIEWGGWDDLQTFLDHYQGKYSPEARKRERNKVRWL